RRATSARSSTATSSRGGARGRRPGGGGRCGAGTRQPCRSTTPRSSTIWPAPASSPRSGPSPCPPSLQDPEERPAADLVEGEPGRGRLFGRDGPAVEAAQEEVQQALAGGGVVEDVADERR